jgi:acetylcholinesterase
MFGWLTDEEESLANAGLWDQRLALEWVNAHISEFGGDPSRIALVGWGEGAASIMVSTRSTLFDIFDVLMDFSQHHITAFAGNTNPNPPFYRPEGTTPFRAAVILDPSLDVAPDINNTLQVLRDRTFEVVNGASGVHVMSWGDFIDQLRTLNSSALMEINRAVVSSAPPDTYMFAPVMGDEFVPQHPAVLLRDGKFNESLLVSVSKTPLRVDGTFFG